MPTDPTSHPSYPSVGGSVQDLIATARHRAAVTDDTAAGLALLDLAEATDGQWVLLRSLHITNDRLRAELAAEEDRHTEFVNEVLEGADDHWDCDEGASEIAVRYVRHLEDEVNRLGGCLRPWCQEADGEPCDHGRPA